MDFRVRITNARVRIYRGGDRSRWVYTDNCIQAEMFNIQISQFFKDNPEGGIRLIFELATRDEELLNRIDAYGEDMLWSVSGSIAGVKHLIGKCKDYDGEERVILKLVNVHMRPAAGAPEPTPGTRFKVVPGPKYKVETAETAELTADDII